MATHERQTEALQALLDTLRGEMPVDDLRAVVVCVDWTKPDALIAYDALARDAAGTVTLNDTGDGPRSQSATVTMPHLAAAKRVGT